MKKLTLMIPLVQNLKNTIKFGSTTLIVILLCLDIQKSFLIIIESAKITLIRNTISIRKEFS